MFEFLKKIFSSGPQIDLKDLMDKRAQIIDVRTSMEFKSGHIKGSVNIPLHDLRTQLSKIKKDRPIITCCASGSRSGSAVSILKANGYPEVFNGGGWLSLKSQLSDVE
jgi:rhodanese-related sulfurtransferase